MWMTCCCGLSCAARAVSTGCTSHADVSSAWQDGSISEAVAWECPPQERHLILDRILQHVLSRHLDGSVALHSHSALLGPVLAPKSFLPAAQHSAFRCWQG